MPSSNPRTFTLLERSSALEVLERNRGDLTQTSSETGISRSTLTHWRDHPPSGQTHKEKPISAARREFCKDWPHLTPAQVVAAGHRTLEDWLRVLEKHR